MDPFLKSLNTYTLVCTTYSIRTPLIQCGMTRPLSVCFFLSSHFFFSYFFFSSHQYLCSPHITIQYILFYVCHTLSLNVWCFAAHPSSSCALTRETFFRTRRNEHTFSHCSTLVPLTRPVLFHRGESLLVHNITIIGSYYSLLWFLL